MKIVFFGTPGYVLPILTAIHKKFMGQNGNSPIVAVVTQSPKPAGRTKQFDYSPVDKWAHTHRIPTYYDAVKLVKEGVKADLGVLESYGTILPPEVLNYFPHGIINAHPSLLPKYRGSSPAQATILKGEKVSGGTIIKLDKYIDHGPVIFQFRDDVLETDTAEVLRVRIFDRAVDIMVNLIEPYLKNKIKLKPQNDSDATITIRLKKEDAFIPPKYLKATFKGLALKGRWEMPFMKDYSLVPNALSLERFIRAMDPWPVAWTNVKIQRDKVTEIRRLKILKAHLELSAFNHQLLVIDEVQLEGKNKVSWEEFLRGYPNAKFS